MVVADKSIEKKCDVSGWLISSFVTQATAKHVQYSMSLCKALWIQKSIKLALCSQEHCGIMGETEGHNRHTYTLLTMIVFT